MKTKNELQNVDTLMESINKIINLVNKLLSNNPEWKSRYKNYIMKIEKTTTKRNRRPFHKPEGISLYSSVSRRDGKAYDLRFDGQSVGEVVCGGKKVWLYPQEENNKKHFKEEYTELQMSKKVEWSSSEASNFRRFFRNKSKEANSIKLNSPEHRLENRLLKEFAKKTRAEGKVLCNIQPVRLYNCFFQLPTPLKASDHVPEYSRHNGGGIDILARVKSVDGNSRICVMELKDENKKNESQAEAMKQAISYSVFIATLLRSESGSSWWDFIMNRGSKTKPIPEHLNIDVVTVMPEGSTEEFCEREIDLQELSCTLYCHTLYYNSKDYINGKFTFTGTYPPHIKK